MVSLPPSCQRTHSIEVARKRLSKFVVAMAQRIVRVTGVNYEESLVAPSTHEEVMIEWRTALETGKPFRVYSGASDCTIYDAPDVNWAFRFWHDYLHVKHNLGMGIRDEMQVGALHWLEVSQEFGDDSLEAKIIAADTSGQALYHHIFGTFVADQEEFVLRCLHMGMESALATYRKPGEVHAAIAPHVPIRRPIIGAMELAA